jgi:hypothetical protein
VFPESVIALWGASKTYGKDRLGIAGKGAVAFGTALFRVAWSGSLRSGLLRRASVWHYFGWLVQGRVSDRLAAVR